VKRETRAVSYLPPWLATSVNLLYNAFNDKKGGRQTFREAVSFPEGGDLTA
jgi:hypothetical protein